MNKFENVDVFSALSAIMKQNTGFYQSDFEIGKKIILRAAASHNDADKTLLWLSRPSGTHCFRERDVFLKGTAPNNTWHFHKEQTRDRILAYAVELTGTENGKIKGNLYELDYAQHYERVRTKELPADTNRLIYVLGNREQPTDKLFDGCSDPQLGKFERFETLPNDPYALQELLQEEKQRRAQLAPGNLKEHIEALREARIEQEAQRIASEMKGLTEPNSPNRTHFMVEVSPVFMMLASSRDTQRLSDLLPYKTLALSKISDRHGIFALVNQNEDRSKEIRKTRPSIRAQLKAAKETSAPKRAAKTKHHELEV
jgi:hypothetical protein